MARILFSLWFTLLTLPGPGLCCCSAQSLLRPATTVAPGEPAHSCCCAPEKPATPAEPEPPRPPCPCKDLSGHLERDAVAPVVDPMPTVAVEPFVAAVPATLLVSPPASIEAHPLLPFHPTADILHVFHMLRC